MLSLNPAFKNPALSSPRLLVSVRNVAEAAVAIQGGCDILDIKEPRRGSLGMADPNVLRRITEFVKDGFPEILVTAALGEAHEYQRDSKLELPTGLGLVKLGCAQLANVPNWRHQLRAIRQKVSHDLSNETGWVAVAYADWELAKSPHPADVIDEALAAKCRGVLIDTHTKSGRGLLDWMTVAGLHRMADQLHAAGLFLALAGSLKRGDLDRLQAVPADIIAVRGAVCRGGLRTDTVDESLVRDLRNAIHVIIS